MKFCTLIGSLQSVRKKDDVYHVNNFVIYVSVNPCLFWLALCCCQLDLTCVIVSFLNKIQLRENPNKMFCFLCLFVYFLVVFVVFLCVFFWEGGGGCIDFKR